MVVPNKVKDLPAGMTTAIGSLPDMNAVEALGLVFRMDIPALPSFPTKLPSEGIVAQALGSKSQLFENIKKNDKYPLPIAYEDFSRQVQERGLRWLKFQWVGPLSIAQLLLKIERDPAVRLKSFSACVGIARQRVAEVIAGLQANRRLTNTRIVFFFDEPSYFTMLSEDNALQAEAWQVLRDWVASLIEQDVIVGVHCCARADLSALLSLPISVLSFDTELLIPQLFSDIRDLGEWLAGGGRLALGLVPTLPAASWNPIVLVEELRVSFRDNFGRAGDSYLKQSWLTPACGLAMRTVSEAVEVVQRLRKIQEIIHE